MTEPHEPLEATLRRLARERDEADARYNTALTALDQVPLRTPRLPAPPPHYDEQQITPLNQACDVLVAPPVRGGLKGRLAAFVWRLVAPTLERQAAFNSIVVDHINRNVRAHRAAHDVAAGTADAVHAHMDDLQAFRARLMLYLQQITPFVDTKDRDTGAGALTVNAAVNALADDVAKRQESMAAQQARIEARLADLAAVQDQIQTLAGVAHQAALAAKREIERLMAAPGDAARASEPGPAPSTPGVPQASRQLDSYKYVGFENQFRGSQETIRARLESYLPYFASASDVLDVGCGRGEFLDLLADRGVTARGLDLNHEMVEVCRARGLDVAEGDAVSYLDALPDASLGGLFAAQVVEHLRPEYLLRFLELAHHKLRPGAPIVLETLNPACWVAFFESYIRDITHAWPLHPETLRYLVLASGFTAARIEYRSPVPPQDRLQPIAAPDAAPDLVEAFNGNVEKLNARMFTFMDYAIVGTNA
ncbi:MAG TPA: methionine biosynthesis protein MetW [Vicinamibacterales bacterium]|nr:methionine biosynthesis protein MetW [Vicinamibacterales bacterium]